MKLRILNAVAVGAGLSILLSGCIVLSVYPFYNRRDIIADSSLAGHWVNSAKTNELWQITAANENSYALTTADGSETNAFSAHAFRLRNHEFMDLITTNRGEFVMPLHLISLVSHTNDTLSLQFMDYGWMAGYLETNPVALRHITVFSNPDDTNSDRMVYLTAGTADLQKFLLSHVGDSNAFSADSSVELSRLPQ